MLKLSSAVLACLSSEVIGIALQESRDTPEMALRTLDAKMAASACPAASSFSTPANGFSKLLRPGGNGRVFFIGDDVIGDLCEKGSPGLCCSALKPCSGASTLRNQATGQATWELWYEKEMPGFTRLRQYPLRSRSETAMPNSAYVVNPELPRNATQAGTETVARVQNFLTKMQAGPNDVLVLGLLGRQSTGSLSVYDAYTKGLIRQVVNGFQGRAVLLSASPAHPTSSTSAQREGAAGSAPCLPAERPGVEDPPINNFQNAIFVFNVWAELSNQKARLVDVHDMLLAMGPCHRDGQCRTWSDATVSMVAQLALNALEKLPM